MGKPGTNGSGKKLAARLYKGKGKNAAIKKPNKGAQKASDNSVYKNEDNADKKMSDNAS